MAFLIPKNWTSFQHYRDRSPAWIKLHRELLDDFEFHSMQVASRALAPMLWLLASQYEDGKIEYKPAKLAFRFRMSEKELVDAINPLIEMGFFSIDGDLEQVASKSLAECLPREEKRREEKEKSREEKNALATRLPNLFPDVDEQIVADFKAMRTKQKAPITKTAIDGIAREAAKAGLTLEGALRICCERNWRGFKADWVLSAAKPTNQSGAWWASEATILAKGEEMGMRPNPGEAMTQFKGRIDAAIASIGKPKVVQATRILPAPEKHDTRTFKPASVDLLSLVKGRASA